jgi:hypothetical protein
VSGPQGTRAAPTVVNKSPHLPYLGVLPNFRRNLVGSRTIACGTERQPSFHRVFPRWRNVSEGVSAEFCAKQGSEFCTPMAKNRIRDNASLSAPNDAGADHGRRGSRKPRCANGLTSTTPAGRTGSRLRTSRSTGVLREATAAGRGSAKTREQFGLARQRERRRRLSPSFGCSVCSANLLIGRKS